MTILKKCAMNCEQANQIDLVDYLNSLGYQPQKIRRSDYWYFSPFRNEKEPSFKINRNKNVWYDHGLGKGGNLIDFLTEFHHCDVSSALQRISFFHQPNMIIGEIANDSLSPGHKILKSPDKENGIKIVSIKSPLHDLVLLRYLLQRGIKESIADQYTCEVQFTNMGKEKLYKAIGFKNDAGGYELRNEYFKGSSSPKDVTYINNNSDSLDVFEGFFDFMTYQAINERQPQPPHNFLILNSLAFFQKSQPLMERHNSIYLYLDHDNAGRIITSNALKSSPKFKDESILYKEYKDLNEWHQDFGNLEKQSKNLPHFRRHL
jgi:hypothetical protein